MRLRCFSLLLPGPAPAYRGWRCFRVQVVTLLAAKTEMHHTVPFCWLPRWTMGESFFFQTKVGARDTWRH